MSKTDQRFFIRIPVIRQGKTVYEYLPTDPSLWHLGILKTFYVKKLTGCLSKDHDRFMPAHGAEALMNVHMDPAEILEVLREMKLNISDSLDSIGSEGERCSKMVRDLNLEDLIEAVASCDIERGKQVIRQIMYMLLSSFSEVANDLQKRQSNVHNLGRRRTGPPSWRSSPRSTTSLPSNSLTS